jgi:hypothetical protein
MTTLHHIAQKDNSKSVVGMAVSYRDNIIGKVINILRDKYDELEGLQVRKDADSSIMSIHSNRIAGIDESSNLVYIN